MLCISIDLRSGGCVHTGLATRDDDVRLASSTDAQSRPILADCRFHVSGVRINRRSVGLNSSVLRWSLIVFRYAAAAYQLSELIQLNAVRYILRVTAVARALASENSINTD